MMVHAYSHLDDFPCHLSQTAISLEQSMKQPDALSQDERLVRPVSQSDDIAPDASAIADLPMARSLNVDDEIKFVESLLTKYVPKDDKAAAPFQEIKSRVVERQRETRLFLGVIGEFSSGKSTLVNALIRDKLLRTDVLQGTTAAATLLCYGDSLDVQIRRKKKWIGAQAVGAFVKGVQLIAGLFSKPAAPPTREELLQLIHQATSNEQFAQDIVQVDVRTPSATLRTGLIVVDTPGANASNPRHAQVTAAALRDVCDAALVVVPAEAAGSESLFQFLKTHAADVMYRCVFVVTKIDLIRREKERERVLQNLRARIVQQLGIANPRVLPCAPQFVIESLDPQSAEDPDGFTREEIQSWMNHFVTMERELHQVLKQKRLQAQVDDIAKLAMQLLTQLQAILQQRLEGYRQRHEALAKVVIPDVDQFIDQRVNRHVTNCRAGLEKIATSSGRDFHKTADSIVADMSKAISGADSRKALTSAVESTIPGIYSSGQRRLQRLLQSVVADMSAAGTTELKRFHDEFQLHFRALATLGGALDIDKVDARAVSRDFSARGEAANQAIATELKGLDQQQKMATMGMSAGGAVIGTMLLPGIGTVIGGLLGGMFSMMFGPSLDELKNQCWSRIQPEVVSGLESFGRSADAAIESTAESTITELGQTIASYLPRYQGLVQKMKDRDAAEKSQLEEFQIQIQFDLGSIEKRRQHLEQLRLQLRDL